MKTNSRPPGFTPPKSSGLGLVTSGFLARGSAKQAIGQGEPRRQRRAYDQYLALTTARDTLRQTQLLAMSLVDEGNQIQHEINKLSPKSGDVSDDMTVSAKLKLLKGELAANKKSLLSYQEMIRAQDKRLQAALVEAGRTPEIRAVATAAVEPRVEVHTKTASSPADTYTSSSQETAALGRLAAAGGSKTPAPTVISPELSSTRSGPSAPERGERLGALKQQLEKLRREEKQASKELQDFLVNAELLDFSAKVIIENTQRGNGKLSDVRTQISATEAEITKLHRAAALEEDKVKQYALALASQPGDALSQRQDEHSSPKTTGRLRTLKSELEVLRSQENEIDKGLKELVQASLVIAVSDEMILGDTKALADIRAKIAATEAEIGNLKQGEAR